MVTPTFTLLIILTGISLSGIIFSALLMLRLRKVTQRLEIRETEECGESDEETGGFAPVLRRTDLHLRMQQGSSPREMPEKYRFIRLLADRGVPAGEIAEVLNLAAGEVEQLMALAQVGRQAPPLEKDFRPKRDLPIIKAKDFSPAAEMII